MRNKNGFTLIETVICMALTAVISAAFLHVTLGAAATQRAGNGYDQQNAALITALATGSEPDGVSRTHSGEIVIRFDNGESVSIEKMQLSSETEDAGLTYYRYGEP